ncbi:lactonase family protein, partial [Candidatus Bathyarchaeota archaeon]|nr:lactonase family protein [Candidatus Bathyarchaeota archaeon]
MKDSLVFVGTYTWDFSKNAPGKSEGIYAYRLEASSGDLELVGKTTGVENPSFIVTDSKENYLYSVNELRAFEGKPTGTISSFSINKETGELTFLNRQLSGGSMPCHLCIDKTDKFVLVSNFFGGSASVFPIARNGSLREATDFVQHQNDPKRNKSPRAHSATLDPANKYAFVADRGLDKIMIYRFDSTNGKLTPNDTPWFETRLDSGPRHFTFHPNGKYAYLINERDSTLISFAYDNNGGLRELQTVSCLPKDFTGKNLGADIHVNPAGKFVYGSNRGHDSIVIFGIEDSG